MAVVGPVTVEAVRPVASKARRGNSAKRLTIHVGTIVHSVVPKGARAASSEDGVGGFAGRCRERFEVGEDDDGYAVYVKMRHYLRYLLTTKDDSPL